MAERPPSIEERISAALAPADESPAPEAPTEQPVQEVEQDAPETGQEAEAQEPAETADESDSGDVEEVSLSSLHDLAEHFGIPVGELYNLSVPVTGPDGQRMDVTLSEWKDSFQASAQAKKAAQEAQNLRDALQSQQQALAEAAERQAHEAASYMAAAEQQLLAEFNSINWDTLRQQNPVEWAAKRQEFAERNGQLQRTRYEAAQAYEQRREQMAHQYREQLAQVVEREHNALMSAVPEWRDEKTRTAEQAGLRDFLLKAGYTEADIEQAYDHRMIVLARKAMKFDAMQSAANVAKKKLVKIAGTVLKPGAKADKAQAKQDIESSLKAKLRKSGRHEDAAELIRLRLGR